MVFIFSPSSHPIRHFHWQQMRRAAYALPDGVEFYVGEIRTTFTCPGNGYFADTDNNCQLFHICLTNTMPDGTTVSPKTKRDDDEEKIAFFLTRKSSSSYLPFMTVCLETTEWLAHTHTPHNIITPLPSYLTLTPSYLNNFCDLTHRLSGRIPLFPTEPGAAYVRMWKSNSLQSG